MNDVDPFLPPTYPGMPAVPDKIDPADIDQYLVPVRHMSAELTAAGYDLTDYAVRSLVMGKHVPRETWIRRVDGPRAQPEPLRCEIDGQLWPCELRETMYDQEKADQHNWRVRLAAGLLPDAPRF